MMRRSLSHLTCPCLESLECLGGDHFLVKRGFYLDRAEAGWLDLGDATFEANREYAAPLSFFNALKSPPPLFPRQVVVVVLVVGAPL